MGNKTWPVLSHSTFELKVCDICSGPIRLVKEISPTLVNAAKTFSAGHIHTPGPMIHPTFPTGQTPPQTPNSGILEG